MPVTRSVPLPRLLAECPEAVLESGPGGSTITGVTNNSRLVKQGGLFVAVPGLQFDGNDFIPSAIAAGAIAVVSERPAHASEHVSVIRVPSARAALADLAAAFWDHPSRKLTLIGVTGTDGKTSTTQLIGAIARAAGKRVGWLTTEGIRIGEQTRPNTLDHTTPEAPAVQEVLAEMVDNGVELCVLEVSSHALALDRVRGCEFDVAVFTNLSPEHVNFHGSLDEYRAAKSRLFGMLPSAKGLPSYGVVNRDDASFGAMREACAAEAKTYGLDGPADFSASGLRLTNAGAQFTVHTPDTSYPVRTRLLGRFNVLNWLAAIAATSGLGVDPTHVQRAAELLEPVRGRMEPVDLGQPYLVVVDFAHTPQALETALTSLKSNAHGKLFTLFGQAGGRDPANRPSMGAIAARLTDFFVITLDDPIHEDPTAIAQAIAAGARDAGAQEDRDFVIDLDRGSAVRRLIHLAQPGDIVLLAGKGHEQRMLVGSEKLPWDDATEARLAIAERQESELEH